MSTITTASTKTIQLSIKGQNRTIAISNIPIICDSTKSIFEELGVKTSPSHAYPLAQKAGTLVSTIEKLTAAKKSSGTDKKIAFLKSLLYTAIMIVGIWSACAFTGTSSEPFGFVVATVAFLACACFSYHYKKSKGKEVEVVKRIIIIDRNASPTSQMCSYLSVFFLLDIVVMPFTLIWDAWTKVSKLEKSISEQKQEIEGHFSTMVDFFQQDLSQLQTALTQKIQDSNTALGELRKLSIEVGRTEITQKRIDYEIALKALEQGIASLRVTK